MRLTSRVLFGTLAMTAAVSGSAATAHAATPAAPAGPSRTDSLLCPLVTSGPLRAVLDDLNRPSVAESCPGSAAAPATAVPSRP